MSVNGNQITADDERLRWLRAFHGPSGLCADDPCHIGWLVERLDAAVAALADRDDPDWCTARCGGIVGHQGHHQTDDYGDIVSEARSSARADALAQARMAVEFISGTSVMGGRGIGTVHGPTRDAALDAIDRIGKSAIRTGEVRIESVSIVRDPLPGHEFRVVEDQHE